MGLEADLKKEIRMTKIRKAILTTVEVAGVISIALMAPKVMVVVDKLQRRRDERLKSAVIRLVNKGLLKFDTKGVRLTDKGKQFLLQQGFRAPTPFRWDKKWRVVIFDIPETKQPQRIALRQALQRIGFVKLQNSVWVYPYDCEELITLLKTDYRIGKEVLYMIVDKIERDGEIRRHFDLT